MDQTQSHASDLYLNVKGGENDNGRGMWNKDKHEEVDKVKLRKGCKMYVVDAWLVLPSKSGWLHTV